MARRLFQNKSTSVKFLPNGCGCEKGNDRTEDAQDESGGEGAEAAVLVAAARQVDDEHQLREEDDVDEVGTEQRQAVDARHGQRQAAGRRGHGHDRAAQHHSRLPAAGLCRWRKNSSTDGAGVAARSFRRNGDSIFFLYIPVGIEYRAGFGFDSS